MISALNSARHWDVPQSPLSCCSVESFPWVLLLLVCFQNPVQKMLFSVAILLLVLWTSYGLEDCMPAKEMTCNDLCSKALYENFVEGVVFSGTVAEFDCLPSHIKVGDCVVRNLELIIMINSRQHFFLEVGAFNRSNFLLEKGESPVES